MNKIDKLFQDEVLIMVELYEIVTKIYMFIQNHFTASIYNYSGYYFYDMEKGNNCFYDGIDNNGKIFKNDIQLNNILSISFKTFKMTSEESPLATPISRYFRGLNFLMIPFKK